MSPVNSSSLHNAFNMTVNITTQKEHIELSRALSNELPHTQTRGIHIAYVAAIENYTFAGS